MPGEKPSEPSSFSQSKSAPAPKSKRPMTTSSVPRPPKSSTPRRPPTSKTLPYSSTSRRTSTKSNSSASDYQTPSERRFRLITGNYQLNEEGYKVLDLSVQGITTLYGSLFSDDKIGVLDLHGNNIRSVPPAISRLRNLTKLDLSRNSILCMHLTDYSGLPADVERLVNLVDLRLSECNFVCIPPVIWRLKNLRNLDLSRNRLNMIPQEIGNLTSLRTLNLKRTNISTLPLEIAYCQRLEVLILWGNQMDDLPETISDIPNLKVMSLNYRSFSRMIDAYREALLCSSQIISDHIPSAIFEMRAIEALNLEATKINVIPAQLCTINLKELNLAKNYLQKLPKAFFKLAHLEVLDLSKNIFQTLSEKIGQLKSLRKLYFSGNLFEKLPVSLFSLERLEELDLSKNRIRQLPREIGNLQQLTHLNLRHNNIQSLPGEISNLNNVETLDIGENSIRELPLQMADMVILTEAHSYRKLRKHGLWVDNNPLKEPPPEIWRTTNTQTIFDHLKRLKITKAKETQQLKVILFGNSPSGKTCLKNVLVNGWSDLGSQKSTRVLETAKIRTPNGVRLMLYDLGCDKAYAILRHMFLDSKSLSLIVYNHSTYTSDRFFDFIGRWLQVAWVYMPETIVKIVGTHSDAVPTDQAERTLLLVQTDVREYIELYRQSMQEEIAVTLSLISASNGNPDRDRLQSRREKLSYILQVPKTETNISVVSNASKFGIETLVKEIETMVVDGVSFPHIYGYAHPSWFQLCASLKRRTDRLFLLWEDILEMTEELPPLDQDNDSLYECLSYLHNTGDILWYPYAKHVSKFIFHRPQMFASLLAELFRSDLADCLTESNRIFACRGGMSADDIASSREMLTNEGQISRPLLKCIWFTQGNVKRNTFDQLVYILPLLDICYKSPVLEPAKAKLTAQYFLVVPSFCTSENPSKCSVLWPSPVPTDVVEKCITFKFLFQIPAGLFENLCASLHSFFCFQTCWLNATYGETDETKVLVKKNSSDIQQSSDEIHIMCRACHVPLIREMLESLSQTISTTLARIPGLYYFVEIEEF